MNGVVFRQYISIILAVYKFLLSPLKVECRDEFEKAHPVGRPINGLHAAQDEFIEFLKVVDPDGATEQGVNGFKPLTKFSAWHRISHVAELFETQNFFHPTGSKYL